MSNSYLRFQALLKSEPVTRGAVISVHNDDTISCTLSGGSTLRVSATGYSVGEFVYLKGDVVTGKAPTVAVTEVSI